MLLRVQSPDGTKRIEVTPSESLQQLYDKASMVFGVPADHFSIYQDRTRKQELACSARRSVRAAKLSHGDMIFLHPSAAASTSSSSSSSYSSQSHTMDVDPQPSTSGLNKKPCRSALSSSNGSDLTVNKALVVEDAVDQQLVKLDGRIPGKRNPLLCHHKGNSKCIHCTDIDPWDENYLKENNIKHMSFHTYIRRLKSGVDKGKFVQVSNMECSIKPGCTEHPPWPQGICSKCQPSAVTLTRQTFRHVDAVIFENRSIVENFLTYWRTTGHQRAGMMYGRHVVHPDVPLGIRAEVAAIYEPPQEASADHLKLLPDANKSHVDEMARQLGLSCVGWVFTDLVPLDQSTGTVRHLRHSDTYFLSSHEVITAATLQLQHPSPCALASSGSYGSKFATVIVTGDSENQVHMEGYQVSHQCEALVAAKCLLPTLDAPELAYVRESSAQQYVPDVFFKEKDEYGNEVTRLGRPLPVEYLLLDLPVSTPNTPTHTFTERDVHSFPIENRLVEGHLQDFQTLAAFLRTVKSDAFSFLEKLADFHVLLYLSVMDVLPLGGHMAPLLKAIKEKDTLAVVEWRKSDLWSTLEQLVEASPPPSHGSSMTGTHGDGRVDIPGGANPAGGVGGDPWTCLHCTFINQRGDDVCDMCHLPR
ncbi:nuclear protein localization protein 4 homolog [Hyalella azteca]|uniref:Nuclear protein localization protein 4 homolog n=1 Tax=Hyalella azteca TaxID=294128 RepID=A0A8B7PC83_HYAAZ|nr:nuclear protein localization protein 4 homolog [Hyalella azteca]XP_047740207.1 nuclear protein localization protein 4 homolog [Hyalella azteca]